ncbi:DUF4395 family protein [Sphingomonas sp.]|uniref:DUF4395 family protein n=1 Tax=Sphingomonas sp. TaxID=28214 RepID=UPI00286B1460|nr:DUF4395 family protein [Sphingomonas sp.]
MTTRPITFNEFHEASGAALAQWATVEDAFCDLFTRLVWCAVSGSGMREQDHCSTDGFWVLGSVFYSSTNFRARIDLLDRNFRFLVKDAALLSEWNAVKNKHFASTLGATFLLTAKFGETWRAARPAWLTRSLMTAVIDVEARAAIGLILDRMRTHGLIA